MTAESLRSDDRFLDGRVRARQPAAGFRSGLDAVMVAAAVPAVSGETILELGSGAGVAALCVAARVPGASIWGVERDFGLVELARGNAAANRMDDRLHFYGGDVMELPRDLKREFHHVFCNPPFHDDEGQASPHPGRAAALHDRKRLAAWLEAGLKRTASSGSFTAILRADRLGEALAVLPHRGTLILPLWPREGAEAKRVIVQTVKSVRRPLALLPGLVLHDEDGGFTPAANAILRDGVALSLGSRPFLPPTP